MSSGSWKLTNALIGTLQSTLDKKNGLASLRFKSTGADLGSIVTPNFVIANVSSIQLYVAKYANESGALWRIQKSLNGTAWTDVSTAVEATATLTKIIVPVNQTGNANYRFVVSGTLSMRINMDDITFVTTVSSTPTPT